MDHSKNEIISISDREVLHMMQDTSQLAADYNANALSTTAIAAKGSDALANNVEFWKWMGRNYQTSGIFDSGASMQQYITQGAGKEEWLVKQLQGKGYEWDWMSTQRSSIKNALNTYDAGDVVNRAASDVTERSILTGKSSEYQMKAYTSKTNLSLSCQILVKPLLSAFLAVSTLKLASLSLVFSLTGKNKGNFFQPPPTTLSSRRAEERLASLVAWA